MFDPTRRRWRIDGLKFRGSLPTKSTTTNVKQGPSSSAQPAYGTAKPTSSNTRPRLPTNKNERPRERAEESQGKEGFIGSEAFEYSLPSKEIPRNRRRYRLYFISNFFPVEIEPGHWRISPSRGEFSMREFLSTPMDFFETWQKRSRG